MGAFLFVVGSCHFGCNLRSERLGVIGGQYLEVVDVADNVQDLLLVETVQVLGTQDEASMLTSASFEERRRHRTQIFA